jgi:hypothetical protein
VLFGLSISHSISVLLAALLLSCSRCGGCCRCCCQSKVFPVQVFELSLIVVGSVDLSLRLEATVDDVSLGPLSVAGEDLMKADERIFLNDVHK